MPLALQILGYVVYALFSLYVGFLASLTMYYYPHGKFDGAIYSVCATLFWMLATYLLFKNQSHSVLFGILCTWLLAVYALGFFVLM